jgi:glycosyltransferase involved in cell wall biosynthesis
VHVLYVVYWGALEPLGQSLVLPAIKKLAGRGIEYSLVTFEKREHLDDTSAVADTMSEMSARGIRWLPLRYHKRPKVPATAFDIAHGAVSGLLARRHEAFDLIHARTFVGGPIGLALSSVTGTPFLYHNEGFYPDEQVDGGVWRRGSWAHRAAKTLERLLYRRAGGIMVLSRRAMEEVRKLPGCLNKPIMVVPSAVDLDRFTPAHGSNLLPQEDLLRLIYVGSVGGRYLLDRLAHFAAVARSRVGRVHLRILTPASPTLVRQAVGGGLLGPDEWSLDRVPYRSVPAELSRHHVGLFFLTQGLSEHGCSPTKVGEYWASGLPIVTTANVSDVDDIIASERVGVVVREHTDAAYTRAVDELVDLLKDPDLSNRCRQAAERNYSLDLACDRLAALYTAVAASRPC